MKSADDLLVEKVQNFLGDLGEHITDLHAQVLISWNEQGDTRNMFIGSGNLYARRGMAESYLDQDKAQITALELSGDGPDDPGESGDPVESEI